MIVIWPIYCLLLYSYDAVIVCDKEAFGMKLSDIKGFTLIELLIVVAIIGILAAIAIPLVSSYRSKSYNAAAVSDLRNITIALETYYTENHLFPN